jgi:hypothetical protein
MLPMIFPSKTNTKKRNFISVTLVLILACSSACHPGPQSRGDGPKAPNFKVELVSSVTAKPYHLIAGGPHSIVVITNAPESNPVSLSLVSDTDTGLSFRVTNNENHAILLWNVRVQVRSKGAGTDGFGWDTVADDYPSGQSAFGTRASGDFRVQHPGEAPWRVCVLYSTDWADTGNSYSGNYEVMSQTQSE